MLQLRDILQPVNPSADSKLTVSVELFPPATPEAERRLLGKVLPDLIDCGAQFCSVTYGAGGADRAHLTLHNASKIRHSLGLHTLMHITRMGLTKRKLNDLVVEAQEQDINNFLVLGGDAPESGGLPPSEFNYAIEMIEPIKRLVGEGATIGVAGYPEGNIAYKESCYSNWRHLVEKLRAGADFVISQMFFDNRNFLAFRDFVTRCLGRKVPILAGVMPITPAKPISRFIEMTGVRVPRDLGVQLERLEDDPEGLRQFGLEYCLRQSEELIREGVHGIHYYCLNRFHPTGDVLKALASL